MAKSGLIWPPNLVPQGTDYPYSSAIGPFVIGYSPVGIIPEPGPPLKKTIPSYLYWEYQDDDDLQAFVKAYNTLAQEFLDWFNALNLPIYTSATIIGALLDWVGLGLYGLPRPVLGAGARRLVGPLNTYAFNTLPLNQGRIISNVVYTPTTDDVYKRVLTWHFFKGDGKVFTVRWLKRRIMQFLTGTNGVNVNPAQTYQISVSFGYANQVNITLIIRRTILLGGAILNRNAFNSCAFNVSRIQVVPIGPQFALAQTLKEAIDQGLLELPFQFTYIVTVQR